MLIFHLSEPGLDLGLGTVGGDHLGDGPLDTVGEQDPLTEDPVFQALAGVSVGVPGQSELGRGVPGQGGGEDFAHPAGSADRGDVGFDGRAVAAGVAARHRLQLGQAATGLGQGLVEPAGLLVVQGRRVCQHRAPGHSQGGHFRVDTPHAGIPVVVNRAVAGCGNREQAGMVARRRRVGIFARAERNPAIALCPTSNTLPSPRTVSLPGAKSALSVV